MRSLLAQAVARSRGPRGGRVERDPGPGTARPGTGGRSGGASGRGVKPPRGARHVVFLPNSTTATRCARVDREALGQGCSSAAVRNLVVRPGAPRHVPTECGGGECGDVARGVCAPGRCEPRPRGVEVARWEQPGLDARPQAVGAPLGRRLHNSCRLFHRATPVAAAETRLHLRGVSHLLGCCFHGVHTASPPPIWLCY